MKTNYNSMDRNTIKTSKVNTINVSHESMKLTWTSAEQIPPPPLKIKKLYKVSEAELSLGNIKTHVK